MIQINELRVCNLTQQGKVLDLGQYRALIKYDGGQLRYDYRELFGIPLSEEILLKVGFEKDEDTFVNSHGFTLGIKIKSKITYFMTRGTLIEIKYIHQLQNLYFALTGQELNTSGL